jgi:hypothetical protein
MILWLGFGLRLYHLDFQSIWWDEGHSIFVASQPIAEIPTLPAMDVHPPAYFVLLRGWIALTGHSPFALRYLSVIFSLFTIALIWRLSRLIINFISPSPHLPIPPNSHRPISPSPLLPCSLASLLAALSPLYIAYAQEVRSYAMITALALAATFTLWRLLFPGHRRDTGRKRGLLLLAYIILSAASLYTHYFTIFLLLFHNLVWLIWTLQGVFIRKYPRPTLIVHTGLWLASQLGILLLFSPQLWLAWRQVTGYTNPNLTPPALADFISRTWQAYTVGLTLDPGPARWGMGLIAGALALGWLLQLTDPPSPQHSRLFFVFSLLLLWLLLPLAAYFLVLQRQPSFEPRYLILVTPALFLLLSPPRFTIYDLGLKPYILRFTLYALRFIILLTFLFGLYNYYTNTTYFKDDSAGVAAWLAAETTPADIVYVDVPHPFHYYARQIPAPTRYLFVDIHTAAQTLSKEAARRDRLFWVTWSGSDTDPRGVIPFLAEKAGRLAGQRDFKGYRVTWFELPNEREISFSLPEKLTPMSATFGEVVRLDGFAFGGQEDHTTTMAEPVWVTLHFSLLRQTDTNYKVSLRLRGADGRVVAQVDRDLLNDRHFRTSAWPVADPALNQAINVYLLPLAPDTPPGSYQLEAVVYNAEPPYPAEGVTGHDTSDGVAAVLGQITVIL